MADTDFRFFTNTDRDSLLSRFQTTLKDARYFDVLVGYLRASGFNNLYKAFTKIEKMRVLVGLSADRQVVSLVEESNPQGQLRLSRHDLKQNCAEHVKKEFENCEDSPETEDSVASLRQMIKDGKLEIRAFPERNIHAKVYITRFPDDDRDFGSVITGSSNFSENGLKANHEFNVELKDTPDVKFALERFEQLWEQSDDITSEYIDTIDTQTWLNPNITPYEIYLKFLYEYFKEEINFDKEGGFMLPDGFMELEYQKQAVTAAKKILNAYNGVFLADVVGLGKTYITALLLQQMPAERKLIICPPVLMDGWKAAIRDFRVGGAVVESLGKLDKIEKQAENYDIIVIDEAHRFRNEVTFGFEKLQQICQGKKVVLVSATPINNKFDDLLSLIKLFQPVKRSTIPGVVNLEEFFKRQSRKLNGLQKGTPEYRAAVSAASAQIRNKVLSHLMVRRTRTEIKKYFDKDIKNQGLHFPEAADPRRIIYQFDEQIDNVFNQTIDLLKEFSYSRYTPLLFLKEKLSDFAAQRQKNIGGFMKGILVKRLESSFYAFKQSTDRFVLSYERFIDMFQKGTVYISNKVNVYDLLDNDQEDKLLKLVEDEKAEMYSSDQFNDDFLPALRSDLTILRHIQKLWKEIDQDPKADEFVRMLKKDKDLAGKKVIVFTESKETSDIVYKRLAKEFKGRVIRYSSEGGDFDGRTLSTEDARQRINENFDPREKTQSDDIDILITTDVLAEGVNLHRSNILVNYDLPWNPTRVLQRVGRVNRVGSSFAEYFVYNCFPTSVSNDHLHLEENIISKIQAFHDTLGEDAKYLSEDEEIESHELSGRGANFYKRLNDKNGFNDEDENAESELKYLNIIRDVRDKDPALFDKIKRLPKKARTASVSKKMPNALISFFRRGALKKFVYSDALKSEEIDFMTAAKAFECGKDQVKKSTPANFFDLLKRNKAYLDGLAVAEDLTPVANSGRSNEAKLQKDVMFLLRDTSQYTEEDEEFLRELSEALEMGSVPKKTVQEAKKALDKQRDILLENIKAVHFLKSWFSKCVYSRNNTANQNVNDAREIILSEYFYGE